MTVAELEGVDRLKKDVRAAAASLGVREARFIVDAYYLLQEHRIEAQNQVRALTATDEPNAVLGWLFDQHSVLENEMKKALQVFADAHEVGRWSQTITGIGPVLAAGLLAHIDIDRAPTVGHIWRFAGLDPTMKWLGTKGAEALLGYVHGTRDDPGFAFEPTDPSVLTDDEIAALDEALVVDKRGQLSREQLVLVSRLTNRKLGNLLRAGATEDGKITRTSMLRLLARRPWNADLKVLCCIAGQTVTTRRGHLPIENVQVGDQVLTHLGRWKNVTRVFENDYAGRVNHVHVVGKASLGPVVTDGHPMYVREHALIAARRDNGRYVRSTSRYAPEIGWRAADALELGRDDLFTPSVPLEEESIFLDMAQFAGALVSDGLVRSQGRWPGVPHARTKAIPATVVLDEDVAWLVGIYIAEGHVTGNHLGFSTNLRSEQSLRDRIAAIMEENFGLQPDVTVNEGNNACQQVYHCRALAQTFGRLFGKGAHEKAVPTDWTWRMSDALIESLIDGIVDGDGRRVDSADVVTTVSESLVRQLHDLAGRVGRLVGVTPYKSAPAFKVNISRENRGAEFCDTGAWHQVRRVDQGFYEGKVYNLEVEDDHSYVVEGIAVHNCWKIGESFVKVAARPSDFYGKVYVERKLLEEQRNAEGLFADQAAAALEQKNYGKATEAFKAYAEGRLPQARIHARAKRYAVKLFLAHWHHVAYEVRYGKEPPKPYILTNPAADPRGVSHTHFIAPPNWPLS